MNVGDRVYAMNHAAAEACMCRGWLQGVARVSACSMWMMTRARSATSLDESKGEAPSCVYAQCGSQNIVWFIIERC